ncbi:tyrosine-protein phosphatase [Sphingomonas profundi]|uniref:tyrosine-protein phosphatase n=1 Tax=Alterirhizorhabdus profundi TaxID=2681549 RepID=UPI002410E284|nr:tyrosine-protein phosphatase [Sphingomonas profundi]
MLESIVNLRDFGGLPSRCGSTVVRDRLFRSGAVASVGDDDATHLHALDFALVVDLRYAAERDEQPSSWPGDRADRVLFHDGDHSAEAPHLAPLRAGLLDEDGSDRIYAELYRALPFDAHYPPLFRRAFARLMEMDGRMLAHCSAGKDRTGMFVALVLHALGVPRDAIVADYMRSSGAPGLLAMAEPAIRRFADRHGVAVRIELMRHLLDVKPDYLMAFFDEIEHRCGSVDAYLDTVGLTGSGRAELRRRLLVG